MTSNSLKNRLDKLEGIGDDDDYTGVADAIRRALADDYVEPDPSERKPHVYGRSRIADAINDALKPDDPAQEDCSKT